MSDYDDLDDLDDLDDVPVGCECPVGLRPLAYAPSPDPADPPIMCLSCGCRVYGYSSKEYLTDGRRIDAVLPLA